MLPARDIRHSDSFAPQLVTKKQRCIKQHILLLTTDIVVKFNNARISGGFLPFKTFGKKSTTRFNRVTLL